MVIRDPIEKGDETAGNTGYRTTKTIIDAHLQSSHVKIVKVRIERCVALNLICHATRVLRPVLEDAHIGIV